jgi:hypothetical protein
MPLSLLARPESFIVVVDATLVCAELSGVFFAAHRSDKLCGYFSGP